MQKILTDFAATLSFPLSTQQADQLAGYAQLVWDKKDVLNLTSCRDIKEVCTRHICDGLQGAAQLMECAAKRNLKEFSVLDAGAGAGFIGITLAAALPCARVKLVESINKRCTFMNWALLMLGLSNVQVVNMRLGEKTQTAQFVTERAMGQLPDIFSVCMDAVEPGGVFMAYQGENPQIQNLPVNTVRSYHLPADEKIRHLVLFEK